MNARLPAVLAAVLAFAGCGSAPPIRHYTLSGAPASTAAAPLAHAFAFRIEDPVIVPSQVDRPQIVLRQGDGALQVLEEQRWVSPLVDDWREALADAIAHRLGVLDVSHGAAPAGLAVMRLQLDLQRFEMQAGGRVLQQAQWSLRRSGDTGAALVCRATLDEAAGADVPAMVAAQQRVLARLADEIAASMRALNEGRASCR